MSNAEIEYAQIDVDDYDVCVTIDADYFSCSECGLILDSYELLREAGLPVGFEAEGDRSDAAYYEGDYGND